MARMSSNIDWTLSDLGLTLISDVVKGGSIAGVQWGKLVRINLNDIQFNAINVPFVQIAKGAPLPAPRSGTNGILAAHGQNSGPTTLRVQVDSSTGHVVLNYNASVSTSLYYSGFLMYFTQ